jgi:predicted peroxiredoxin
MSDRLIFICSHGKDDPERAILAFIAANTAAMASKQSTVLCTIDGVWIGTKDGTDGFDLEGFPPLAELYADFIANGGEVWLCGACTRPRKISDEMLAEGARIVGVAMVIEEVSLGAKTITYA